MSEDECTIECKVTKRELKQQRAMWLYKWGATYCAHCKGEGVFCEQGDLVPYGSTTARLPDWWEPCPDCYEQGICPRCGEQAWNSDEIANTATPCPYCGWQEGDCMPSPDQYECECWYAGYLEYAQQEAKRQNEELPF